MILSVIEARKGDCDSMISEVRQLNGIDVEYLSATSSESVTKARRLAFLVSQGEYICYSPEFAQRHVAVLHSDGADVFTTSSDNLPELIHNELRKTSSDILEHCFFHRSLFFRSGGYVPFHICTGESQALAIVLLSAAKSLDPIYGSDNTDFTPNVIDQDSADSLVAMVRWLEDYFRRHGLLKEYGRDIDYRKLVLKHTILRSLPASQNAGYLTLFKETDPSVLEGSSVGIVWRLAFMLSRSGRTFPLRILTHLS